MECEERTAPLTVAIFPMRAGEAYDAHVHRDHQLAWASIGVLSVETDASSWVLPPTRALWIPAGVSHATRASGNATMRSVYVSPGGCPLDWPRPTAVGATSLLAELIGHLQEDGPHDQRRQRAEAFFFDLLQPLASSTIEVRVPLHPRAAAVARALLLDPADRRDLSQWARQVGSSERTLARAFAGMGVPFGRWRIRNRLRSALPALAAGEPVARVAESVGYETASAFVAAFRAETGLTPRAYFGAHPGAASLPDAAS